MANQARGIATTLFYMVFFIFPVLNLRGPDRVESLQQFNLEPEESDAYTFQIQKNTYHFSNSLRNCDFSQGRWVYSGKAIYSYLNCPLLNRKSNCQRNGRRDDEYLMWKWRPNGCSLPNFNGRRFLEAMRGTRVMLVGDSIMRNQWDSLICLIQASIPGYGYSLTGNNPWSFNILSYNVSIEFHWAPVLVEMKTINYKKYVYLDWIEDNAKHWRGVDILLFDSAHWWNHDQSHYMWDYLVLHGRTYINYKMNSDLAYHHALLTWSRWIETNLRSGKARIIFRTAAARHNGLDGGGCKNRKTPNLYLKPHTQKQKQILQHVLRGMKIPVYLLDITKMSAARRDGHPSVYGDFGVYDCSHWCLPGVPDTWNEMLSAILV